MVAGEPHAKRDGWRRDTVWIAPLLTIFAILAAGIAIADVGYLTADELTASLAKRPYPAPVPELKPGRVERGSEGSARGVSVIFQETRPSDRVHTAGAIFGYAVHGREEGAESAYRERVSRLEEYRRQTAAYLRGERPDPAIGKVYLLSPPDTGLPTYCLGEEIIGRESGECLILSGKVVVYVSSRISLIDPGAPSRLEELVDAALGHLEAVR